ncbi:MAG: type II toxin-antitoxin system PemK/MazF family toxin [Acidimicrobiales bacterium]
MRGDVHELRPPATVRGPEPADRRYAVVLQASDLPLSTVIVAPTSTSCEPSAFRPPIEVGGQRTRVMVEQLAAVDWTRLGNPMGRLSTEELRLIDDAIGLVLALD